ncbi:hypothetical protein [Mucilaginibacter sp.]|jgi:hypothetical protein|uniref:hypothetical protein n=1 Tax=Mucilaginibacter sp. TaxID=1882438 RepID=UPI00356A5580
MNILKGLVMAWLLLIAVNVMAKQQEGAQDSLVTNLRQKLGSLKLDGITITDIQFVPQGNYTPAATGKELTDLPDFCRVAVTLRPASEMKNSID